MNSIGRFIQFSLIAALGAVCFAAAAEGLLRLFPKEVAAVQSIECTPTAMVISLDKSFSMVENNSPSLQKVREAVQQFVAQAKQDDCVAEKQFGLVTFNEVASIDIPPGGNLDQFDTVIGALNPVLGDSTIIEQGVDKAREAFDLASLEEHHKVLFLLTDAENFGSTGDNLRPALERIKASDIDMRVIMTVEGPHAEVFRDVLGLENVQLTNQAGMGESFFNEAQAVLAESKRNVLIAGKPMSPFFNYLSVGLWTGLVTAGITLALLIFINRFNKRRRLLSGKEALTVLFSLGLGLAIGFLLQFLFSLPVFERLFTQQGNFFLRHSFDFLIWALIGVLLAGALAGFKILPNLKILNALGFGLLGGLLAGLFYSLSLDFVTGAYYLPRLIGAATLGLGIGLSINLLKETSAQFPIWLRVYYTSDKVYRYHPIGSAPTTVGSSSDCDVYVHSDHERLWQFWIEGTQVMVKNFLSEKVRALGFREVVARGAIELRGIVLKIVDDKGPEKGLSNREDELA